MATVNLNPSSTVSNEWGIQGGGTAHGSLNDSNDSTAIQSTNIDETCIVQLDDYSSGGTIDSIRHYIRGYRWRARSGTTDVQVILENSSGTALYSQNHSLAFNSYNPQDFYGTLRATSDGSSAWTDGDLDGLRLNINTSPEDPGFSYARVVKAYVEVTYTAAEAADNATFFGANF
jgi:hypothetical protein